MTEAEFREKFIAIVGLPRSGTTLLTALLDRHSHISLYYEPWNASPKDRPAVPRDVAAFRACMEARFGVEPTAAGSVTGFKETTTNEGTTGWAVDTIDALSTTCELLPIWIQRDPVHCFLSKLEGAKKWWGYPDAEFSRGSLAQFLSETESSYDTLGHLLRRHNGWVVRYEALAREPASTLSDLMKALGEEIEPAQLEYHAAKELARGEVARDKMMGDPNLIANPEPVSGSSIERRDAEAQEHRALIEEVFAEPRFAKLMREFGRYDKLPPVARL